MDEAKQKALKSAGWQCGDAEDFLGTSDANRDNRIYYTLTLLARVRVAKQALETPMPHDEIDSKHLSAARDSLVALENKLADDYYKAIGAE